jgi:hypothetical protein
VVIAGFQIIVIAGAHASCAALLFPDVKVHDSASFGSHLGNVAQIQECASRTWPILNLGMLFSNKCSVRLNIRRMDRFISTIILVVKPGWLKLAPALGAGCIDQSKEPIMRSVTYTFAAALLAAACQFSAANAQTPPAQSPQDAPQAQSPAPANPAASIPDQKLDAAAAAIQRVASLKRDYLQQLEAAPPDDQPGIANEARNALEKAVTDQGLSVEEYTTILEMAQNDPQVRQKIIERIQAPAK